MKIGWLICTAGIFGSVREVIENSNAMIKHGADVTIYTPEGLNLGWLPYSGKFRKMEHLKTDALDCLIFANVPEEPFYSLFENANAKVKAFCQMGFPEKMMHSEPTEFLTHKHHQMIEKYWGLADGWWQIEYMSNFSDNVGPSIGGVNMSMFHPEAIEADHDISWTGDHRKRKGGEDVKKAIEGYSSYSYFRKGLDQMEMHKAYKRGKIFVDGHYHGGWCNPVVEAMACGVPVVCTDIPCTSEFAFHEFTALTSRPGDVKKMRENIERLLDDWDLRQELSFNALEFIKQFDYEIVGKRLYDAIKERVDA